MAKQRDPVLDSMRGIGIVLMVLGHAGFPGSSFIYLFHMALFFMLSGWFFSPHTGESAHRLARFAKRKVVTLWLPFVAANTVYTLLTNLFLKVNILTGDERILNLPGNLVTTPVTIKDIIGRTAHWSVFDGGTQLGGAMWFIQALFQISLLYAGVEFLLKKLLRSGDTLLLGRPGPSSRRSSILLSFDGCCCQADIGFIDGTCCCMDHFYCYFFIAEFYQALFYRFYGSLYIGFYNQVQFF